MTENSVTSPEDHWDILENEANNMKKIHKDDSSDSKHLVETVTREKYEVLDETVELNKVTTETAAKEGNAKNEQSSLPTHQQKHLEARTQKKIGVWRSTRRPPTLLLMTATRV